MRKPRTPPQSVDDTIQQQVYAHARNRTQQPYIDCSKNPRGSSPIRTYVLSDSKTQAPHRHDNESDRNRSQSLFLHPNHNRNNQTNKIDCCSCLSLFVKPILPKLAVALPPGNPYILSTSSCKRLKILQKLQLHKFFLMKSQLFIIQPS